jgi:hypothetical protein
VHNRLEDGDRFAAVENQSGSVVLDAVHMKKNTERDSPLPLVRPILFDADLGGEAARSLVHERARQDLGDAVARRRPRAKGRRRRCLPWW